MKLNLPWNERGSLLKPPLYNNFHLVNFNAVSFISLGNSYCFHTITAFDYDKRFKFKSKTFHKCLSIIKFI